MRYLILSVGILLAGCSSFDEPAPPPLVQITPLPQEDFSLSDLSPNGIIVPPGALFGNPDNLHNGLSISRNIENDTARNYSNSDRFIVVNIPAQNLRVFENGEEVLRSKVIVGKPTTRTPTQRSVITSLKLNPDWHAPAGGNIERTYTNMIRDGKAEKLTEINISWYRRPNGSYQFYQPPGELNVLGRIKFEMNSPSNTYLHDTNRPDLFNLPERFISFGCIRVQEWDNLAAWMLGWKTHELIEYLDNSHDTEFMNIDDVEIHIVYWQTEILDGREVSWPDVYNKN